MRVFAVTVTTLCLALLAEGYVDYHLKCTREELGVRWPSYHSNSEYYVCTRVGGKQLLMSCNPGELFTFVLQACTSPGKYIPPPPMDVLPTTSPLGVQPGKPGKPSMPGMPGHVELPGDDLVLPKPLHPTHGQPPISSPLHPPVIIEEHPPNWEMPVVVPPQHVGSNEHEEPTESEEEHEISGPNVPLHPPVKPSLPGKPKPKPQASAPTPPTPAPTPPTLQSSATKKQPAVPSKKKPALPNKKQTATSAAPAAPAAPAKKQPSALPKKQPPVPPKA